METHAVSAGLLPAAEAVRLADLVAYQEGAVVSRVLVKEGGGSLTVFAFDGGQALSEHTTPFDAFVTVLDGEARLTIGGKDVPLRAGESLRMPANVPHAVHASTAFKMLLVMVRTAKG